MPIDDFERAEALTEKLKASLPFQVRLGKQYLNMMHDRGEAVSAEGVYTVEAVDYSGDMGGIVCCFVTLGKLNLEERHVASITHLKIDPEHPLAEEVEAYQSQRIWGLKLQDQGGFASELLARKATVKRKRRPGFGK